MSRGENIAPTPTPADREFFDQCMRNLPAAMVERIAFEPDTSCWRWTPANVPGPGQYWDGKREHRAHRAVYEAVYFKIRPGLDLPPLCRNTKCVNPDHRKPMPRAGTLRLGRSGENIAQVQRSKTHCPRGHEYSEDNTSRRRGRRYCKTCQRARSRRQREAARTAQLSAANDHHIDLPQINAA